jgi:very-short-patch-repair endonuclease
MAAESDETGVVHRKRHSRRPDLSIAAIAGRQHGVISLVQLRDLGLSLDEIRHRLDLGWLRRIHRAVFAVGYEPLTREGHWWAALLAAGDDAVLSHWSAAALWGLVPEPDEDVHVTVPGVQRRPAEGLVPHRNRLDEAATTVHLGIPTTTPLQTLVDLAATADLPVLERAIRQAEYEHLTSAAALAAAVADLEGRGGVRKLRTALAQVTEAPGVTRSRLESRFLAFLRRHSLPKPKLNVAMQVGDRWIEVDCVWEDRRVIVELDGRAAHTTGAAFESDRARDAALTAAHYRVIRVTWRRLREDAANLAAELRAILAESDETGVVHRKRHSRRAA